uniref:Mitochondrial ribosome-associated GTPase 1 n=1 Tax=Phallusia mammillata TaxID=59560 RepID=A0A6F9DLZ1_9ASCI|nr:mitochondrial ribosome-associated GTPase 1-like [Phallusia mammillata]
MAMFGKTVVKTANKVLLRVGNCCFCQTSSPGTLKVRKEFDFGGIKSLNHWFPAHMSKGLTKMRAQVSAIDCVIEVHDARIPFSGRNPVLSQSLGGKPYVIVLNKADLIEVTQKQIDAIHHHYRKKGAKQVLFANCAFKKSVHKSAQKIIPSCVELIKGSRVQRLSSEMDYHIMVVGLPNVGKSSLINAIRKQRLNKEAGTSVGKSPGHTRAVMHRVQVYDKPKVWLLDTPGIFQPKVKNFHDAMKLGACNTIKSDVFGPELIMDYLLFCLNKKQQFRYVEYFNLSEPSDNARTVLMSIVKDRNYFCKNTVLTGTGKKLVEMPNEKAAAEVFLTAYREGKLGKFILDDVS